MHYTFCLHVYHFCCVLDGDPVMPAFGEALHNYESYTTWSAFSIYSHRVCFHCHLSDVCRLLMQLYKTRDEKYLLDLQRVSGPQLLFLDLCAAFLTQLRVL